MVHTYISSCHSNTVLRTACAIEYEAAKLLESSSTLILEGCCSDGVRCRICTCSCRTRFYRAELRGTAAWEHDLEQGMPHSQASLAASSPSLGGPNALASGLSKAEVSGTSKAWGSANIVMASDGTPIMPSSTIVRPKAKVSCTSYSFSWTEWQRIALLCSELARVHDVSLLKTCMTTSCEPQLLSGPRPKITSLAALVHRPELVLFRVGMTTQGVWHEQDLWCEDCLTCGGSVFRGQGTGMFLHQCWRGSCTDKCYLKCCNAAVGHAYSDAGYNVTCLN